MKGQLNLYLLLELLASEAALIEVDLTLLKESAVIRRERKKYRSITSSLFLIWGRLTCGERNARQTLKAASRLMPL